MKISKRVLRSALTSFTSAAMISSLVACSSNQVMTETATPVDGTAIKVTPTYEQTINSYSDGESEYTGFYNNFEYKATLLNSVIRDALITRQSEYYQWEREKMLAEREKANKDMASETNAFLSFFTPDRKNDNLADVKAIWRVYLEVGGQRYEGKVKKLRTLLAELQAMYPYHTRWNTPYMVTFPVPTTAIETQVSTLTVTGPLGTRTVKFLALK